eukprot:3930340-Ditylum_brightwellii.AAC.1
MSIQQSRTRAITLSLYLMSLLLSPTQAFPIPQNILTPPSNNVILNTPQSFIVSNNEQNQ